MANRFDGDGRNTVRPPADAYVGGRYPLPSISKCTARKYLQDFKIIRSYYSATGGLLWIHEAYCKDEGLQYKIEGIEDRGWRIWLT